jgi:hypothetical protein
MVRLSRAISVGVLTFSVLISTSGAAHARPVAQVLNPPPPSFETCTSVGSGTICSGQRTLNIADEGTGIVCGTGDTTFEIVWFAVVDQRASRTYDRDGNLSRRSIVETYSDGTFENSVTGKSLGFTLHDTVTDVLGVPADFSTAVETVTGGAIVAGPDGGLRFAAAGRTVSSNDGLDMQAGPGEIFALFANGAAPSLDLLCPALIGS